MELFRRAAEKLASKDFGETQFSADSWEFVCTDWDTMTSDIEKAGDDPTRMCNVSFGGIDAGSDRILAGKWAG